MTLNKSIGTDTHTLHIQIFIDSLRLGSRIAW